MMASAAGGTNCAVAVHVLLRCFLLYGNCPASFKVLLLLILTAVRWSGLCFEVGQPRCAPGVRPGRGNRIDSCLRPMIYRVEIPFLVALAPGVCLFAAPAGVASLVLFFFLGWVPEWCGWVCGCVGVWVWVCACVRECVWGLLGFCRWLVSRLKFCEGVSWFSVDPPFKNPARNSASW